MKLLFTWFFVIFAVGYGFLPISMNFRAFDFSKPNTLEIDYQVCGCPCANARIIKGQLQFSENIKQNFPDLQESGNEITLKNIPLFENITGTTQDILCNNKFKVIGEVVGVDTILCDPLNCEIVPIFYVSDWKMSYEPKFWLFNNVIFAIFSFSVLLLPILIILTIKKLIKRKV